ncbi:uncharacterized protein BO80DRAFT_505673 [Aspergillus ibericus CBS 121593]|uniref:MARVEL domain-containing protein n=1 Tax=Aspergillus ibericus CBS 121593 TaxID=1448316 RepID=A0A395GKR9_9EURO|nr:hypothetical protein BO80DRAFT_505673 [Aspergillus ibericus CBS 121593]RAK96100.1 hypothetical protein BO80DRAFT_505673 [Aspergillus ibericus CBS 121593]
MTPKLTTPLLYITTILLLLTSFILTTYTLTTYLHQATHLTTLVAKVHIHNHPILITTSYHIFATICTVAAYTTSLFHLWRSSSTTTNSTKSTRLSWIYKALTILGLVFLTTSVIAYTIILATGEVTFGDSVGPRVTVYLDENEGEADVVYKGDGVAVAGCVVGWVGWGVSIVSCVMMLLGGKGMGLGKRVDGERGEGVEKKVDVEVESEVGSFGGRQV